MKGKYMLRLIDKDELLKRITKGSYSKYAIDLVEGFKEVEAIPIEWIKKWSDSKNKGKQWNDTGYQVIRDLIDDWRNENE